MTIHTTLSRRGAQLAASESIRDKFGMILNDPYDPVKNPNGFVNMGVAENYSVLPEITEFVNKNMKLSTFDFTYGEGPWGTARLRRAMAKFMTKNFHAIQPVDPEDILFGNGVTALSEMLGYTLCDEGDGILFSRPIYQAFQVDFGIKARVKSTFTDFGDVDQFAPEAAEKYEEALYSAEAQGTHVRALMLCNPHNPLGKCYPKETIIALMKLCDKHKIHLLCDEIYATSVYDVPDKNAVKFTSALSFDTSSYIKPEYLHIIYGMSKDFASGGLRIGCILIRDKRLMRAMGNISQFAWSGNPSQKIATTVLENDEWLDAFLQLERDRLATRNKLTRQLLDDAGIKYSPGANAGFFLWVDLRAFLPDAAGFKDPWDREKALVKKMVDKKMYITEGQGLSAPEPGFFRIIFSQDEAVIRTGMKRLQHVLGI